MERHVSRLLLCIHPWTGHTRNARTRDALFQGIDGSTTSHPDPHMMHSGLMGEDSSMIQRWNSTWDATVLILDKSISNTLDAPFGLDRSVPRQEEPDYDLPTESIPPSPHPSRSDAPHEDEGTAQAKSRMRRPAQPSIEEERKIKPFAKKPITFMFHATYGDQLISIMENGLKSGKSQSNPSGRAHIHMACIDDVILDDDAPEAALTHAPTGSKRCIVDPCIPQGPGLRHPTLLRANSVDRTNHRGEEYCCSI